MKISRHGHACVRVDDGRNSIVIDPGGLSDPDAIAGADAVLYTHSHFDHFDLNRLRESPPKEIVCPPDMASTLSEFGNRVRTVEDGVRLFVGGFSIDVVGSLHASIHHSAEPLLNMGYLVAGRVYHPGDNLFCGGLVPEVLLLPISGPWLKTGEAMEWVEELRPRVALPIHGALLSETGLTITNRLVNLVCANSGVEFVEDWGDGRVREVGS